MALLGNEPDHILLPNVVTEASNLLAQIANPYKDAVLTVLKAAVLALSEEYVVSRIAVSRDEFRRLRLTDCALLSATDAQVRLLIVELDLYLAFLRSCAPHGPSRIFGT